jgi:hypothetical protein
MRLPALVLTAAASAFAQAPEERIRIPEYPQGKVARVYDQVILTSHVIDRIRPGIQGLRETYPDPEAFDRNLIRLFEGAAFDMVQEIILLHEARTRFLTVTEADLDDFEREHIRQKAGGDREKFKALMQQKGLTLEAFRDRLRTDLLCQRALEESIDRARTFVTPEEVRAWYRNHPESFDQPERFRYRVLNVRWRGPGDLALARRKAASLRRQLDAGADFETLVRWTNQDPGANTGETDWRPKDAMDEALAAALAAAKDGEILGPIEGKDCLFIARRDAHEPVRRVSFNEAQPDIERAIRREKTDQERAAAFARIWDASTASVELAPRLREFVNHLMSR